jgi:hypothetical protein
MTSFTAAASARVRASTPCCSSKTAQTATPQQSAFASSAQHMLSPAVLPLRQHTHSQYHQLSLTLPHNMD